MTEKQTSPQSSEFSVTPHQVELGTDPTTEIVTQSELDTFNEWAASGSGESASAARRLVGQPAPEVLTTREIISNDRNKQESEERADRYTHPDRREPAGREQYTDHREKSRSPLHIAGAVAAGAALAAGGFALLNETSGGSYSPEAGDLDSSISEIVLSEGANIRFDPYVDRDQPNNVGVIEEYTTIKTPGGVRIVEDENNGTWYGIDADDLTDVNGNRDKDRIVWVNEQGIDGVSRTGTHTSTDLLTKDITHEETTDN